MDLSSIALQGLAQAEAQLQSAAARLANAGTGGANPDSVDVSTQILELMAAQTLFSINLATLKTADQMQKSTVDLMA